jgi:hypothetical protein
MSETNNPDGVATKTAFFILKDHKIFFSFAETIIPQSFTLLF